MPIFLIPAKDYALENNLTEEQVANQIKNGTLDGKEEDDCWKVRVERDVVVNRDVDVNDTETIDPALANQMKSQGISLLLTVLLGPIGVFYSNVVAATMLVLFFLAMPTVMGIMGIVAGVIGWVASIITGFFTTAKYNEKVKLEWLKHREIIDAASNTQTDEAEKRVEESTEAPDTKECPYCAETIKAKAIVCRYCGKDLD